MRIHVNGVSLFFDTEGSQLEPRGTELHERPTLLAIHGGPGIDHAVYRPYLSPLARVAQIVYLDLRGNGRSDVDAPERWNLATWADDVRAFCDALDIRRPIVLGSSFGGFVAQAYATAYPHHPAKLILSSTNPRFDLARSLAAFERLGGPEAAAVARAFFAGPTPEIFQRYLDVCFPLYARLPVATVGAASIVRFDVARHFIGGEWHAFDFTRALERVCCPTLVMAGGHDPVLPAEGAEELVACLKPGLARFERFEECGHNLLMEQTDRALALIAEFIADGPSLAPRPAVAATFGPARSSQGRRVDGEARKAVVSPARAPPVPRLRPRRGRPRRARPRRRRRRSRGRGFRAPTRARSARRGR